MLHIYSAKEMLMGRFNELNENYKWLANYVMPYHILINVYTNYYTLMHMFSQGNAHGTLR